MSPAPTPANPLPSPDAPRVLVVDDEQGVRQFLSMALQDAGYAVETAADGWEAMDAIRRWSPDVILLDLVMPRMHGWDVARACRAGLPGSAARRPPRLILMTAAGERAQRSAWDAGADAVIAKPFAVDDVLNMVSALVWYVAA